MAWLKGADTLGRVQIQFPITFSAIASVALLGVTYWYWRVDSDVKNTLIFFLAGAAAVAQITASFYTARILSATLAKDQRDTEREKGDVAREAACEKRELELQELSLKQAAFRYGERWNDASMYHARDTLREIALRHKSQAELIDYIKKNLTNVIHVLNFLEEIATACRHEVVKKELMKDQFDFVVVNTWEILFPWIKEHRADRGSKSIWEDLEKLYYGWKQS
jgi:hypothetical protein